MARVSATGAGPVVTVKVVGGPRVQRMLAPYRDPAFTLRAQRATVAGAEVLRRPLKAEAAKVSSRMARAVSIRQAQRNRPAAVVTFTKRVAWFRHLVIGGTKAHGPRRKKALRFKGTFGWVTIRRVRGVRPNPMIQRVATQYRTRVTSAMIRYLARQTP